MASLAISTGREKTRAKSSISRAKRKRIEAAIEFLIAALDDADKLTEDLEIETDFEPMLGSVELSIYGDRGDQRYWAQGSCMPALDELESENEHGGDINDEPHDEEPDREPDWEGGDHVPNRRDIELREKLAARKASQHRPGDQLFEMPDHPGFLFTRRGLRHYTGWAGQIAAKPFYATTE